VRNCFKAMPLIASLARETITAEQVRDWCAKHRPSPTTQSSVPLFNDVQLFQPSDKRVCRSMGFFPARGALHAVQYFIAPVDTWSSFLLASKTRRVIEVANDAPILQMELGREIKLDHRAEKLLTRARRSHETARPKAPTDTSCLGLWFKFALAFAGRQAFALRHVPRPSGKRRGGFTDRQEFTSGLGGWELIGRGPVGSTHILIRSLRT
jgi:hypothetical protein